MTCTFQVKAGEAGLYDGAEVVLGPDSGLLEPGPEQQFINQKMRPGSGVLSVQVLPDGPTRVLQVRIKSSETPNHQVVLMCRLIGVCINSRIFDKIFHPAGL